MIDRLPGTTIEINVPSKEAAKDVLDNIFMCGGLMMGQVARLTGLEPYMIQNWVKRGFLSSPKQKLYTKRQFCRIAIINMLRDGLQIEKITGLLSYINGRLDDESDDIIDDTELYLYYISVICQIESDKIDEKMFVSQIEKVVEQYSEPFAGAKKRLIKVLLVMVNAHISANFRKKAEEILNILD